MILGGPLARKVWAILAYQFDEAVASALLTGRVSFRVRRGEVREVYRDGGLLLVRRPPDGLFSISIEAGRIIVDSSPPPSYRIIVKGDREVKGSILARDVASMDYRLRPGDEVVIVDESDRLIGVGRLRVPPVMLNGLERGEIARVRRKVKK